MNRHVLLKSMARLARDSGVAFHLERSTGPHDVWGMVMKTYRVVVARDDGWWIMHARIPRTIIYSQAKRIDDIDFMIRDAIAGVLHVDPESFAIELTFDLDSDVLDQVSRAREASLEAAEVQDRASRESRAAVQALRREGLTPKEAGYFLGVTPQRVAQLLSS